MKIGRFEFRINQPSSTELETRGNLQDYLSYFGIPLSNDGTIVTDTTVMNIAAVFKADTMISNAVAGLPLEPYVLQDDLLQVDPQSKFTNLLNIEPNPLYSKFNFWKVMVHNYLLNGNGYAYILRDASGNPLEFLLFDPDDIEIYFSTDENKIKYKYKPADGFIDPTNMLHIINHTINGYFGFGCVHYGARSLGLAIAADKTAKGYFESGGNISGLITVTGRLDPAKAAELKTAWTNAFSPYSDGTTPGGVMVMENGIDYKSLSMDPVASQLLESRKFNVEEVARWFNLPASKLGIQTGLNYNSITENNLEFLQTTLQPILENIEGELARKLFRPSVRSRMVAKFNTDAILRADVDSKVQYLSKLIESGLMSINEGRKQLGFQAVDGGDSIIVKSGYQPLDKLLSNDATQRKLPPDLAVKKEQHNGKKRIKNSV